MKVDAISWNQNKNIIVYLLVWTWPLNFRQRVSPKRWFLCSTLHGVRSRNIVLFIYWYLWCYILYLQITEQISLTPVASLGKVFGYLAQVFRVFFFLFLLHLHRPPLHPSNYYPIYHTKIVLPVHVTPPAILTAECFIQTV